MRAKTRKTEVEGLGWGGLPFLNDVQDRDCGFGMAMPV